MAVDEMNRLVAVARTAREMLEQVPDEAFDCAIAPLRQLRIQVAECLAWPGEA